MPYELQRHIKNTVSFDVVWISCEGQDPSSIENTGKIAFYPEKGFRTNQISTSEGSLEPIIAVRFEEPGVEIEIFVKCNIWTKNLKDSVSFSFKID